uniref:Uncharacterized protein n=1 Tax=Oryza brachyantha TaxID=4533 RepID=J3NA56_ORYBR
MARLPKAMMLARDDRPWIIPNFLFIAVSAGLVFAAAVFLENPTSPPMPRSFSILCLLIIILVMGVKTRRLERSKPRAEIRNPS